MDKRVEKWLKWARTIDARGCTREIDRTRRRRDEARRVAPSKILGHPLRGVLAAVVSQRGALAKLGARTIARGDPAGFTMLERAWARGVAAVVLLECPELDLGHLLAQLVVARDVAALEDLVDAAEWIARRNAVARDYSPLNSYMMGIARSAARVLRGQSAVLERVGRGRVGPYAAVQRSWGHADKMTACLSELLEYHVEDSAGARGQTGGDWALYPAQLFALRDLSSAAGCEVVLPEHELLSTPFGKARYSAPGWLRADPELVSAVDEAKPHFRQEGLRLFIG